MSKYRLPNLRLVKPDLQSVPSSQPGKVTHDARGNAVWDWAIATGILAHKTAHELITTLEEAGTLSLNEEFEAPAAWSGDPYNRCGK